MQLTLTNFYGNLDRTSYTADVKDHTGTILYNVLAFKESNSYTLRIRYYATTTSPGEIIVDEQTYTSAGPRYASGPSQKFSTTTSLSYQ